MLLHLCSNLKVSRHSSACPWLNTKCYLLRKYLRKTLPLKWLAPTQEQDTAHVLQVISSYLRIPVLTMWSPGPAVRALKQESESGP